MLNGRAFQDGSSVARKSCPAGRTYFALFCFHSGFLRRGDLVGFFFAVAAGLEERVGDNSASSCSMLGRALWSFFGKARVSS